MEGVRKIIDHSKNPLTIELPEEYVNRRLEIIVLPYDDQITKAKKKYDFSKFVGKLHWEGDALAEQRKLRNEWE
jgi:hypothetical protein